MYSSEILVSNLINLGKKSFKVLAKQNPYFWIFVQSLKKARAQIGQAKQVEKTGPFVSDPFSEVPRIYTVYKYLIL